jgi:Protein of unknown function, DUF417
MITVMLLALHPWSPRASVVGGPLATIFFLGMLSLVLTTPGNTGGQRRGFPVLSATGEFLMRDIALLGLAAWLLFDSLSAAYSAVERNDLSRGLFDRKPPRCWRLIDPAWVLFFDFSCTSNASTNVAPAELGDATHPSCYARGRTIRRRAAREARCGRSAAR